MSKRQNSKTAIVEKVKVTSQSDEILVPNSDGFEFFPNSRQGTAKKAIKLLTELNQGYKEPNKTERINLLIAFAKRNKVVYGKAFDIVKIMSTEKIDLENLSEVEKNLEKIIIYEVKSTRKKEIKTQFEKYFFGLTTAELLVAQNLKSHFRFIFVNIYSKETMELTLKQVFEKAKGIYPVWSIQF